MNEEGAPLGIPEDGQPPMPIIEGVPGMEPPVSQEADRTPITITDPSAQTMRTAIGTPYENAGAGVLTTRVESDEPRPIEPETLVDKETALEMAYAGKDDRDKAAVGRARAGNIQTQIDALPETMAEIQGPAQQFAEANDVHRDLLAQLTSGDPTIERTQVYEAQDKRDEYRHIVEDLIESKDPEVRSALEVLVRQLKRGIELDDAVAAGEEYLNHSKNLASFNAEMSEKSAERLENWAEILHVQPLSEAYKRRYDLEDVTPQQLVAMEDAINGLGQQDELSSKLKRTFLEDIRSGRAHEWQ